ncbi:MAG: GDSL family lipase [Verrucomicrobia bacterium]|nr:GDSL family lipase [Verrucomicrobiota bacterium]
MRLLRLLPLLAALLLPAAANTAIQLAPRDAAWLKRHEGFVAEAARGGVDVLFLGDSITDGWRRPGPNGGKAVWDREIAPLRAANFGIGGDRTQHVLWRIEHGTLEGLRPRVVVLMIGTNNTGLERDGTTPRNTPAETVAGVSAIVGQLRQRLPEARVLLLAVFPRGERPDHPQRLQVNEINRGLAPLADGRHVTFLDLSPAFLAADGTLPAAVMPDFLHPREDGYTRWATALKAPLAGLLR